MQTICSGYIPALGLKIPHQVRADETFSARNQRNFFHGWDAVNRQARKTLCASAIGRRPGMLINHLESELNPNTYLGTAVSPLGGTGGGAVVVVPSVAWNEENPKCELVPVPEPFWR